jgi:hypothetical protein
LIGPPEPGVDADALKKTCSLTAGDAGDTVKAGVGLPAELTPTDCVLDATRPRSLVTVSVTV